MIFDINEFQEAKEKRRLVYHAPLPMKKQRTSSYRYQRNGEVHHYSKEELHDYKNDLAADRR